MEKEFKTEEIRVPLSKTEKAKIQKTARKNGLSDAAFMRLCTFRGMGNGNE